MPNCRTKLVGIQIAYCDAAGEEKRVWVDLKRVHALAWCDEEVKAKPPGRKGSNAKVPAESGPRSCKDLAVTNGDSPVCWWTGSEWVCGEE